MKTKALLVLAAMATLLATVSVTSVPDAVADGPGNNWFRASGNKGAQAVPGPGDCIWNLRLRQVGGVGVDDGTVEGSFGNVCTVAALSAVYYFAPGSNSLSTAYDGWNPSDTDRQNVPGNNEIIAMLGGHWTGNAWALYLHYEPDLAHHDRWW